MQYKTIALELLQQSPRLHEQLRENGTLLPALDSCALAMKTRHEALKEQISATHPDFDPSQVASTAMEIAVQEMESRLLDAFPPDDHEPLSMDAAMAFVRNLTSNA